MQTAHTQILTPMVTVLAGHNPSLLHRWSAVVAQFGSSTAMRSPGENYTFAEADSLSDDIAVRLVSELPASDAPVGAFLSHSAQGLVAFLAIIKAGRIAVVLDSHLPAERIRDIVEIAGITAVVTDAANRSGARALAGTVKTVIDLEEQATTAVPFDARRTALEPGQRRGGRDAASIVFTSGSTGKPKGVVQAHDQLLNEVMTHADRTGITPEDRIALVLPYSFAAGLTLMFSALLSGASVWSFDPRHGGVRNLIGWITDNNLTTLHCTPHLLRSLTASLSSDVTLSSLRLVSTVGEAVNHGDVLGIRKHLDRSATFMNWSGSSEVGTLALFLIPGTDPVPDGVMPAGRAAANKTIRLLRADTTEVAPGEAGEIVTTSPYLSGGYWRDDATNALRFSIGDDGARQCRQGDLGRYDSDGDLVLLGRADAAVKVRGYLVEPGEIEAAFMAIGGVAEVVVIPVVSPPASTRLVAYVVPVFGIRPESAAALRRKLRQRLPEYMVPGVIVQLAALPRNERGKVDRTALPTVPAAAPTVAPTSQWELAMADIWSSVLELETVGRDDDFMSRGGDSLSAEELLTIVAERYGVTLSTSDLIDAPTLREFTDRVNLGAAAIPSHADIVRLQSGSHPIPIFCFAGSGALALSFVPLARYFPERDVFAFQAHGLERRGVPDWSVQAAARRYLEIIRMLQPVGPYVLLGHSYGGLVAMEIAQVLRAGGQEVQLVGLLDTYLPGSIEQQPDTQLQPVMRNTPAGSSRGAAVVDLANRVRAVLPSGIPALDQWSRAIRSRIAGVIPQRGQLQYDAFFDHGVLTARRYEVKPYAGRAVLVLADGNVDGHDSWRSILTGSYEVVESPSEHSSLLREPHVTALAAVLRAELTEQ